ncbi:TadE family protein [Nocardioides sp. LHG3406-4]|uniref:TadE family protein n=1 Tax=Nocardioides sp. LHG3406-4 TaxID=2804575 RepID=UPI003CE9521E
MEFALVMPILFLLVFGILQYGLYFNDSLSTRQGVREGARIGVVQTPITGCGTGQMAQLACETKKQIDALTGVEYVKVSAASWAKGSPLVVCAYVKSDGGVGLLPMPDGGWIFSKTQMSIEKDTPVPSPLSAVSTPALPAGAPAWPTGC